jgi:hypothetical protein
MKAKARRRDAQPKTTVALPRTRPVGWQRAGILTALLFITLLAFSNSFTAGFTLDNKGLLQDPRIVDLTAHNVGLILHHSYWWPNGEAGLYRPFTTLTYLFNYAILGNRDRPGGYHWLNFLLHAGNVVLVYFLLLRLIGKIEISVLIAATWAVHPVLTESVTNIVGRSDLLAGGATLSGILIYLKSAETTGGRRWAWLGGLTAVTFIGVFSKESAVCIIGVILVYELASGRSFARIPAVLLGCVATAIPIGVMLYQRSRVLAASLPAEFPFTDNPMAEAGFWVGRLTAMKVIARYLWLNVWPAKLSCDYSYSEIPLARGTWSDWACCIAVLLAVVLVCFAYHWNRVPFFWACFAAVTFFPMSNLAISIGTIMAERFLYLPSIGLVTCVVLAIYGLSRRFNVTRYAPATLCLVIACLAVRTWARNVDWQDEQSIIAAGLEVSPNSYKLHKQMALLLFGSERTPENIRRGKEEAERSVALLDSLPDVQNTAEPYCLIGEYHFLEAELQNGLSGGSPSGSGALSSSGIAEYQKGIGLVQRCAEIDKAVHAAYFKKLEASPSRAMPAPSGDPQPHLMLSVAYVRLNDVDKATGAVREALRLHPRSPAGYRQIANVFMLQKRREDAVVALTEGMLLTSDPGLANALATVYQEDPDAGNCKVIQTATGPAMNPLCAPIRQRVCALSAEVVGARLQAGREDLAEQQRLDLVHNYGCPSAALDPLFPQNRP